MPDTSTGRRHPLRRVAAPVALVAWGAMIWWFSDQPDLTISPDDMLDFILRKIAHMFVFAVVFALSWETLVGTLRAFRHTQARALVAALVPTLAYAAVDEWHQTFVPGRVGHPQDVLIDMVGAILALVVIRVWSTRAHRGAERT